MKSRQQDQVIIKASEPYDLLAMLPMLAGFTPENSLAILLFRGTRTRGVLRFDLPAVKSRVAAMRFASSVIGMVCKIPGIESVVPVIYSSDEIGEALPETELADIISSELHRSGIGMLELLCQTPTAWGSYFDKELPVGGQSLGDLESSAAIAQLSSEELDIVPIRTDERVLAAAPEERAAFTRRIEEFREKVLEIRGAPDSMVDARLEAMWPWSDLPEMIDDALEWDERWIRDVGPAFMVAIERPAIRDVTMLQWAFDDDVASSQLELSEALADGDDDDDGDGGDNDDDNRDVGDVASSRAELLFMLDELVAERIQGEGPRPDRDRILCGIDLLLKLVALLDSDFRCAPLCMLAWLSWAVGRGSAAGRYIDEAQQIDPDYGMAQVLFDLLRYFPIPEWAFDIDGKLAG